MKLPQEVKAIRARWVAAKGIPEIAPNESSEAWEARLRDTWTVPFDEQVAFELPGQGFGAKRGDPNRPLGKDTIAQQANGRLFVWDLLSGAGTGHPTLNDDPDSEDITGQFFETRPEFFSPRNHLGTAPVPQPNPPPTPQPSPPPSSSGFEEDVRGSLGRIEGQLAAAPKPPDVVVPEVEFPNYVGSVVLPLPSFLGGPRTINVTMKPEAQK